MPRWALLHNRYHIAVINRHFPTWAWVHHQLHLLELLAPTSANLEDTIERTFLGEVVVEGGPPGGGHQRRHSLALPEAKKAAEIAQQKRTTSGFQFPIPGAAGATPAENTDSPSAEDKNGQGQAQGTGNHISTGSSLRGRGSGHGRSQSLAVGANGRGGSAMRGGGSFQFPMQAGPEAATGGQGNDLSRRGGSTGHNRNSSRNFEGNWRNQPAQGQPQQDQQGTMGNFQSQQKWIPTWTSQSRFNEPVHQ